MYILFAILAFGILIFTHEMGHFLAAKSCGVKVLEFSMGMGPRLFHFTRGETEYSLRALPVGGFCAMEGEDGESDDARSFARQPPWKRLIILAAGSAMNFLVGLVIVGVLFVPATGYRSNELVGFYEGCPYEGDLQAGDRIWSVNGERVYYAVNFSDYVNRNAGNGTIDLVIRRGSEKLRLEDYPMVPVEYTLPDGTTETKYGVYFGIEERNVFTWAKYSWYTCLDFMRLVRIGLVDLLTGGARVSDMTGVVGIVDIINETGQSAQSTGQGLEDVLYLVAFIAVNLAVVNMLPIPALDGGHILSLALVWLYEKLSGKRANPKVESYIHFAGLILLLGLMVLVMFNDVVRILSR